MRAGEDIGSGHWIKRTFLLLDGPVISCPAVFDPPEGSVFVGLHDNHYKPGTQDWCGGWIGFANVPEHAVAFRSNLEQGKTGWHELVSADPLEVSPSLACRGCASHGFIRAGRWVEC